MVRDDITIVVGWVSALGGVAVAVYAGTTRSRQMRARTEQDEHVVAMNGQKQLIESLQAEVARLQHQLDRYQNPHLGDEGA